MLLYVQVTSATTEMFHVKHYMIVRERPLQNFFFLIPALTKEKLHATIPSSRTTYVNLPVLAE
jgi:hypothetical protein